MNSTGREESSVCELLFHLALSFVATPSGLRWRCVCLSHSSLLGSSSGLIHYPFPLPSCYSILFGVRQFGLFRKLGMIELYRFAHFYTVLSTELGSVWKQTFWYFTFLNITCWVFSVFSKVSSGHFLVRKSSSQCPGSACLRQMPSHCWARQGRTPFRAYDHGLRLEQKDCWCFSEDCTGVFQFVFSSVWYLSVALGPQLLKNRGYCFSYSWQGTRLPLGDTALTEG